MNGPFSGLVTCAPVMMRSGGGSILVGDSGSWPNMYSAYQTAGKVIFEGQ